jgi:hypothetical protein
MVFCFNSSKIKSKLRVQAILNVHPDRTPVMGSSREVVVDRGLAPSEINSEAKIVAHCLYHTGVEE